MPTRRTQTNNRLPARHQPAYCRRSRVHSSYRSLRALPAEVWLDAAGLARRISVNSEPAAAADAQVWSILELWDFGVAADITPPGPDEILAPAEAYRLAEEESSAPDA